MALQELVQINCMQHGGSCSVLMQAAGLQQPLSITCTMRRATAAAVTTVAGCEVEAATTGSIERLSQMGRSLYTACWQ